MKKDPLLHEQLCREAGKLITRTDRCHFYDQPIGKGAKGETIMMRMMMVVIMVIVMVKKCKVQEKIEIGAAGNIRREKNMRLMKNQQKISIFNESCVKSEKNN